MEKRVDNLRVYVFENRDRMGERAGMAAADAIRRVIREKGTANVMFAAAPSQNETLAALRAADGIDWSRVNAFHMDEYIGLKREHPAGFGNFLKRAIFDQLAFSSVHLIDGNAANPEAEAQRYGELLAKHPIDVCLCGIGENGHLAFNDPPVANFKDPVLVKVVELDIRCRRQQVHDGCFESLEQVPRYALSATIPALTSAGVIVCSVPAATKAEAVRDMLLGDISESCPASILRSHPDAGLYLDRNSAAYILP